MPRHTCAPAAHSTSGFAVSARNASDHCPIKGGDCNTINGQCTRLSGPSAAGSTGGGGATRARPAHPGDPGDGGNTLCTSSATSTPSGSAGTPPTRAAAMAPLGQSACTTAVHVKRNLQPHSSPHGSISARTHKNARACPAAGCCGPCAWLVQNDKHTDPNGPMPTSKSAPGAGSRCAACCAQGATAAAPHAVHKQ